MTTVKTDIGARDEAARTTFAPEGGISATDVQKAIVEAAALASAVADKFPASSTDHGVARYDGVTGDLQDSGVTIDDNNFLAAPGGVGLGGATADATNRLSANTPAVLFNRETDDIQVKLNKEAAVDTASFLFQTGFSGRAEIGTIGDDNFSFKVSPDGSSFFTGLIIDKDDGAVSAPVSLSVPDEAYDATGWNADLTVPTKNAIRDYLETLTGTTLPVTYQPLDGDLTAIAALTTTTFGRGFLTYADEAAFKAGVNLEIGTDVQAFSTNLSEWAGINPSANGGSLVAAADYAAMRALLDLEAGVDFYSIAAADAAFQPLDAGLTDIAALAVTDGNIIVGNGTNWVAESGATARTSLGLGTADDVTFGDITGDTVFADVLESTNQSGADGGVIHLNQGSGSTLDGDLLRVDTNAERFRIFETGGAFRGAYLDLSQCAGGVGTSLLGTDSAGTLGQVLTSNGAGALPTFEDAAGGSGAGALIAIIEDQQAQNTNGGTFTNGADRIRVLNTLVFNRNTTVSLSSNQFTLPAGDWEIEWSAPAVNVNVHQSFLYNVTGAAVVQRGDSARSEAGSSERSHGIARVSIGSSTAYEIRHRCGTSEATIGFGNAANFGTEVYTRVVIRTG